MRMYAIIGVIILLSVIAIQNAVIKSVKSERDTYKNNTYLLMSENMVYRTKDSLNAVSVEQLNLTLKEFRKYRQADAGLIGTLKADNKRLKRITTAQTETIYHLQGTVKDSIIYIDQYIPDTLQCVEILNKWFTLNGCTNRRKEFTGQLICRDSLLYVEHVKPRRFLFFKWGVKERRQEIISRNPYTRIESAEFITIRD